MGGEDAAERLEGAERVVEEEEDDGKELVGRGTVCTEGLCGFAPEVAYWWLR